MLAYYGFKDASGDWFLSINTDKCDGCGKCVEACPAHILEVNDDDYDPFREEPVARVKEMARNKLKYTCAPCRPGYGATPSPCLLACRSGAISQSEGWKELYGQPNHR